MAANKISVTIGKFVLHASGKSATIISSGIVATSVGAALNSEQVEEFKKGIRGAFIKGKKDFIRAIQKNSIYVEVWTSSVEAEEKLQARFTSGQLLLDINGEIKLSGIQFDSIEQIEEWKVTEMSQEEFQENKIKATKEIDLFMESLKENRHAEVTTHDTPNTSFTTEQQEDARMQESWRREEERKKMSWEAEEKRKQERHDKEIMLMHDKGHRGIPEWAEERRIQERHDLEMKLLRKKLDKLEQTTNDQE